MNNREYTTIPVALHLQHWFCDEMENGQQKGMEKALLVFVTVSLFPPLEALVMWQLDEMTHEKHKTDPCQHLDTEEKEHVGGSLIGLLQLQVLQKWKVYTLADLRDLLQPLLEVLASGLGS
jgi:hypothetical protein